MPSVAEWLYSTKFKYSEKYATSYQGLSSIIYYSNTALIVKLLASYKILIQVIGSNTARIGASKISIYEHKMPTNTHNTNLILTNS